MDDTKALAERVPLFADLDEGELRFVLRAARRLTFDAGARLVRQGQAADTALIMEHGRARVISVLPGGGETVVGELGPGSVLGEMALLDAGVRSASVVASEPTACLSMERDAFRMLIAQGNRAVLAINYRITLALCQRLRVLNGRILAHGAGDALVATGAARAFIAREDTNPESLRQPCGFDFRAFLPLLSSLRAFDDDELDELVKVSQVFDVPRGALLFVAGAASEACYVVVRGALEISREHSGEQRRIGILGPGRLCGILGLIENQPHSMSATVREHSTLLAIPRAVFLRYTSAEARGAWKFQQAVNQELLQSLARTNNHLTRLISQARIRNRAQEAHELQQALAEQECRAGVGE
jgi:CRP-like cAMP-binding protein